MTTTCFVIGPFVGRFELVTFKRTERRKKAPHCVLSGASVMTSHWRGCERGEGGRRLEADDGVEYCIDSLLDARYARPGPLLFLRRFTTRYLVCQEVL